MLTEAFVAGTSPLHRMNAKWKFLWLFLLCTLVFVFDAWAFLIFCTLLVLASYAIAKVPMRIAWQSFRPAVFMLIFIFIFQIWYQDLERACLIALRFIVMIAGANLLTLTTKSTEILGALEALFARIFPRPIAEKMSLAISMTLRFVPRVRQIYLEVRGAQMARGHGKSWRALMIPLIIRTLKSADEISDAIHARSGKG